MRRFSYNKHYTVIKLAGTPYFGLSMKRIGIFIPTCSGGGVTKVMLNLAMALMGRKADVHLLVLERTGAIEIPDDIQVHYLFDSKQKRLDSRQRFKDSIRKIQTWVAGLEEQFGSFNGFLSNTSRCDRLISACQLHNVHYVIHSSVEETLKREMLLGPIKYFRKLRWLWSLNGQSIITVSKGIEKEIIKKQRFSPASIRTIYNPFDIAKIKQLAEAPVEGIPTTPFIIHIGRYARQKRHDVLFKALNMMTEKEKVVLLTNHSSSLSKSVKKYGLTDRVIIPDFQQNPYPWIKAAQLLVLSSDFEGLPTVLIEALICGTPVVSTNCPTGPAEILTGKLSSLLVPRRNVQLLALKLDEVLKTQPDVSDADILFSVNSDYISRQYLELF